MSSEEMSLSSIEEALRKALDLDNLTEIEEYSEKLLQRSKSEGYQTGYTNALWSRYYLAYTGKQFEEALLNLEEMLELSIKNNDRYNHVRALRGKLNCFIEMGDLENAIKVGNEGLNLVNESEDMENHFKLLWGLGTINHDSLSLEKKYEYLKSALDIVKIYDNNPNVILLIERDIHELTQYTELSDDKRLDRIEKICVENGLFWHEIWVLDEKLWTFNSGSFVYEYETTNGQDMATRLLEIGELHNNEWAQQKAHMYQGMFYEKKGMYEDAELSYAKRLEILRRVDEWKDGYYYALEQLANLKIKQGEFRIAKEIYESHLEEESEVLYRYSLLNHLSTICENEHEYKEAEIYIRKSLKLALELEDQEVSESSEMFGNRTRHTSTLSRLSRIKAKQGQLQVVEEMYLEILNNTPDLEKKVNALEHLVEVNFLLQDLESSEKYFKTAESICSENGLKLFNSDVKDEVRNFWLKCGLIHHKNGNIGDARIAFSKVFSHVVCDWDLDDYTTREHIIISLVFLQTVGEFEQCRENIIILKQKIVESPTDDTNEWEELLMFLDAVNTVYLDDLTLAEKRFLELEEMSTKSDSMDNESDILIELNLSYIERMKGNVDQSTELYFKTLENCKEGNEVEYSFIVLQNLVTNFEMNNLDIEINISEELGQLKTNSELTRLKEFIPKLELNHGYSLEKFEADYVILFWHMSI